MGQIMLDLSIIDTERTYGQWILVSKSDEECK